MTTFSQSYSQTLLAGREEKSIKHSHSVHRNIQKSYRSVKQRTTQKINYQFYVILRKYRYSNLKSSQTGKLLFKIYVLFRYYIAQSMRLIFSFYLFQYQFRKDNSYKIYSTL